jgi:plasmid stability protein
MNVTLAIDDQLLKRVRMKLGASGRTVNQEIRDHLRRLDGEDEDKKLELDIQEFLRTSGKGDSNGWKWNREELYEDRLKWPRK